MRADGRSVEILLSQGKATFQPTQAVLVLGELLPGHQVNTRQFHQSLDALIVEQGDLASIVIHAEPCLCMQADVSNDVVLLQLLQFSPDALGLNGELGEIGMLEASSTSCRVVFI